MCHHESVLIFSNTKPPQGGQKWQLPIEHCQDTVTMQGVVCLMRICTEVVELRLQYVHFLGEGQSLSKVMLYIERHVFPHKTSHAGWFPPNKVRGPPPPPPRLRTHQCDREYLQEVT